MGDLPLRTPTDRRPGGPLPRLLPNQTHPHPIAVNLWYSLDVRKIQHRVLIRLSPGYALLRGRLDTRYSPVRRSPSTIASYRHDAPRLACVKPVASVHPEPGSNSPLYMFYFVSAQNDYPNLRPEGCLRDLHFGRVLARPSQELNGSFLIPKRLYIIII